jgi:predicted CopG family antitoxin
VHGYALEVIRIKEIKRNSEKNSFCIFITCLSQRREDKLNVAELAYYDLSK